MVEAMVDGYPAYSELQRATGAKQGRLLQM
jgi:hypothetical protein